MAERKKGLGKGLDSLLYDNSIEDAGNSGTTMLKISEIEPNKSQARKNFDDTAIAELADSIAEHGVLQPLLVRPMVSGGYQLIAGERRWRASRQAGLTEVPVIIKALSDEEASVISLIENLQRENLNPVEEANGFNELIEKYNLTQEEAAKRVGKSRTAVTNSLRILKLPKKVIAMVESGALSAGHAKALAGLEDEKEITDLAELIVSKGLSVRETEKLVKSAGKVRKPKEKTKQRRDSYFDMVELALSNSLSRKARVITAGKKESGTLEIAFYDKEDLERIANALSALEE
ncbi:MAG: ParB/RepB/Spo0J family partition protein [Clostridia bacterium]|jgi:ParB family chromosome partitioning protein|nr:ParB/RepB/Spo0J family partition protein [Clostridia bacterium]